MSITVTTPALSTKLTRLITVKRELQLTGLGDDKVLDDFIQRASDFITAFTGRFWAKETLTETLGARGSHILMLSRTPIVSVSQIRFSDGIIDATEYTIEDAAAGFIFRETGWADTSIRQHVITSQPTRFTRKLWAVDYVAGYVLPGAAGVTLPGDIEQACIDIVKTAFLNRDEDVSIKSQRTGDASETRFNSGLFAPSTKMTLERYTSIL